MDGLSVRPLEPGDIPGCDRILSGLPNWFGFEETNRRYIAELSELPAFVAVAGDQLIGFLSLRDHNEATSEIEVMAVAQEVHRQGACRAPIEAAEESVRRRGARLLEVKTLGPSRVDEGYARTRAFFAAMGFLPLEELDLWAPDNPAPILVKPLQ